jgi:glycogen debranching enzyme
VRTSNAGHAFFAGIALPKRAVAACETLLETASFSGWGIRTVSARERRYNPMSYHNGSVWPHDNAMIASGLAKYGHKQSALMILQGLHDASQFFELNRLPELFCGFPRRPGEGPTLYPVACLPQAWAAGSVYMLLQACLGLRVVPASRRVELVRPALPQFLDSVRISNLRVGEARCDLEVHRHGHDIAVSSAQTDGGIEVVIVWPPPVGGHHALE